MTENNNIREKIREGDCENERIDPQEASRFKDREDRDRYR